MRERLIDILKTISRPAIAVSGGVDSLTLASVAAEVLDDVLVVHATSPAVPAEATARVRQVSSMRGWTLTVLQAGEFDDPNYRANPLNRCFFCKTNLYSAIRSLTDRQILSGANTDDLGEYRPGLDAARDHAVRHPYVEAGIGKQALRRIARDMGLGDVAELASSPCLSSRVETGIRIESDTLGFIHAVEQLVGSKLRPATVRCRVRARAVVVELDATSLGALTDMDSRLLMASINVLHARPAGFPIHFATYRNGSAFLTERA